MEDLSPDGVGRAPIDASLVDLARQLVAHGFHRVDIYDGAQRVGTLQPHDIVRGLLATLDGATEPPIRDFLPADLGVTLKVRRIATGETLHAELGSLRDAVTWLRSRPHGMEVLGVVGAGLSGSEEQALHEAMRPLDDDERDLRRKFEANVESERREALERLQASSLREVAVRFAGAVDDDGNTSPS